MRYVILILSWLFRILFFGSSSPYRGGGLRRELSRTIKVRVFVVWVA